MSAAGVWREDAETTKKKMTPDEIEAATADGTFFATLLRETRIGTAPGATPGTTSMTLEFPEWFARHVAPDSRAAIQRAIARVAQQAYDEVKN